MTAPLLPNEAVGPYRIIEQIGAGGMAVVYKAHDSLLNRFVAIKHVASADEDDRRQLRHEAEAHKKLTQDQPPYLVQLIDIIEDARGVMLVGEFVEGDSLEQILSRTTGPMDEKRACRILKRIAKGLHAIHTHDMLHRDLKPANVLIDPHDRVKISDFGLAVAMAEQQVMHVGSVRYMSPELLRGEQADARCDLYALGMIAYEMLAGRGHFDEAFSMVLRDKRNQAMRWMKWHTNPRTTAPPLTDLQPNVSPRLAELVMRLMDKNPQGRVATAEEFLAAMDRLDEQTLTPSPAANESRHATAPADDTMLIPRSNRLVRSLAITLTLLVLLCTGLGANLWRLHHAKQQQRAETASQTLERADDAFDIEQYADAQMLYQAVANDWLATTDFGRRAHRGVLLSRGHNDLNAGRYASAIEAFEEARSLGSQMIPSLNEWIDLAKERHTFTSMVDQINTHIGLNEFDEANKLIREWQTLATTADEVTQLRALREKLADRRTRTDAEKVMTRANELLRQGRRNEAVILLDDAVSKFASHRPVRELYEKLFSEQAYEDAMAQGLAAQESGDYLVAIEAYRQAGTIKPSDTLSLQITQLESEQLLADALALLNQGRPAQAERQLILALGKDQNNQRAIDALKRIESVNRMQGFADAGDQAVEAGDYAAAVKHYENALTLAANDQVTMKLLDARVRKLLNEAAAAMDQGQVDQALALLTDAKAIDAGHPMLGVTEADLTRRGKYYRYLHQGDAARDRSEFRDAKRYYRRAKRVMETPEVLERLDLTEYAHLLAQAAAYMAQEDYLSAKALLRIAFERRDTQEVRQLIDQVIKLESGRSSDDPLNEN